MAGFARGRVTEISETEPLLSAIVDVDGTEVTATGFPSMLGPVSLGDEVIINTTGLDLALGTGGEAFILWNLSSETLPEVGEGHIVKLRYTPWQTEVATAEAQESPHHGIMATASDITGIPVVACGLHSQIAGVAAGLRAAAPGAKIGYLMTDGAALPLAWSRLVRNLKAASLIDATATAGHAFGGDLEVVNVYSGMAALVHVSACDAVIVAMGPGVVGTGTALGFTAIEQAGLLDAIGALGGRPIACLRVNHSDERPRHRGISHHTLTALGLAARAGITIAVPADGADALQAQLASGGLPPDAIIEVHDGSAGVELLRQRGLEVRSMGRGMDEIPELFHAAAAAGAAAAARL